MKSPAGVVEIQRAGRAGVAAAHRGRVVERELDGRRRRRDGVAPDADERVVGIEHGHAARGQRARQRRVLGGDVGDRAHELLVLPLRVVDDRDGGLRHGGQRRGLARVIHAQLDHGGTVVRAQPAAPSTAGRSSC